mgnify:CR=1 FL=1
MAQYNIRNMAQKRTDTTTQLIMDIINKDIEGVIDEWRESVTTDNSLTEKQIVEDLAEQLHWQFNNDNNWGFKMLTRKLKDRLTYDIITAIEDLYHYNMSEHSGCYIEQDKLEDKIDVIYYFEAERALHKAVIEEDLNIDFFEL